MGFFVTNKELGAGYVLVSTDFDNSVHPLVLGSVGDIWDISLEAQTTRGMIWEMLVEEGDPTGETRWKPLEPQHDGTLVIYIGGYSPVVFKKDGDKRQPVKGSWRDTIQDFAGKK